MLDPIIRYLDASPDFREAFNTRNKGFTALYDVSQGQRPFYASVLARKTNRPVVYITETDHAAVKAAEDISAWLKGDAYVFPSRDIQFARGTASREDSFVRLGILQKALEGNLKVLVISAESAVFRLMPPDEFRKNAFQLKQGIVTEPTDLIKTLVQMGYDRVDMVEGKGQCALRGSILDIFPPSENEAVRVEFFDNEVDSIRTFDPISQKSLEYIHQVSVYPALEWLMPAEDAGKIRKLIESQRKRLSVPRQSEGLPPLPDDEEADSPFTGFSYQQEDITRLLRDAEQLESGMQPPSLHLWSGAIGKRSAYIWDYLPDAMLVFDNPERIESRLGDRAEGFSQDFRLALERQEAVPEQSALLFDFNDLLGDIKSHTCFSLSGAMRENQAWPVTEYKAFTGLPVPEYSNRLGMLASDIKTWQNEGYLCILFTGGDARHQRLESQLNERDIYHFAADPSAWTVKTIGICTSSLSHGFILNALKIAVIGDNDIFGTAYHHTRTRKTAGEKIEAFTDLTEGDYVVHDAHGIGIFRGISRIETQGVYRDFLLIEYKGNDKLYVPIDNFDRIQKFIGNTDRQPEINSLGGTEWNRAKAKVAAGLKKLAFNLVQLYAERQRTTGFSFPPDTPWQREFEDAFPYELTPDQAQAVRDIKRDMEAPSNMDRLLCGDVGYGKTEVALRAAMKAVMGGKQVALLAPTTILAQQHYYTALKRFSAIPVRIEVLSRFRSAKQIKETLKHAADGEVDILVGTHRLLSKDVLFKDLGLLIVDEEQRFGVGHKESIKNFKKQIDVLTLSATPIPRTLHMSMVGVRDMSLLTTPPEERSPVQTYVLNYSDALIRDAVLREMNRQGQVFFLYNSVQTIDQFASRLRLLIPEARIAIAHGQMRESALEDIMLDFYEGKYDVLLCSTIIENGLDVQNANTIIIYDADHFGLSQLYQLRGRVGRSSRVAYAYFMVRPGKQLSETAQKRLNAIREFTAFGSGFRIAMRDLEIRGSGNIFGPEQSGNIAAVGYDMYCRMIEAAVLEAKGEMGEKVPVKVETRVDIKVNAYLPPEYVRGDTQRLEIFKRIAMVKTRSEREELLDELIDRFGDVPNCVITLINVAHIRGICGRIGITKVTHISGTLVMTLSSASPEKGVLKAALTQTDKRFLISSGPEASILLRDPSRSSEDMLNLGIRLLEKVEKVLETGTHA